MGRGSWLVVITELSAPVVPSPVGVLSVPAYLSPWHHDHYHHLQGCGPQHQEQLLGFAAFKWWVQFFIRL